MMNWFPSTSISSLALWVATFNAVVSMSGCASTHEQDLKYYSTQMAPGCRLVSEQCTQRSKFPRVIDIHRYELAPAIKLNIYHFDMTVEYQSMKVTKDSTPEEAIESLLSSVEKFNAWTIKGFSNEPKRTARFSVLEKRPIQLGSLTGYLAVISLEYLDAPDVLDKRAYVCLKAPDALYIFRYMPSPLYFDNIRDNYDCEFPCFMSVLNNFSLKK